MTSLERALEFYTTRLGFVAHAREGDVARLGAGGRDLLVLVERPEAPHARSSTGLYHVAILAPSRRDLAHALMRLLETRTRLSGVSDHGVSEALYLSDPDGIGLELYRDRPREEWPMEGGRLRMTSDPLDLDGLVAEGGDDTPPATMAPATRVGHVHLRVGDLGRAQRVYVDVLGFDLMQRWADSALFVSAGGYHHHVGLNTWLGPGAPPPPEGAVGLRHATILLPDAASLDAVLVRATGAGLESEREGPAAMLDDGLGHRLRLAVAGIGEAGKP